MPTADPAETAACEFISFKLEVSMKDQPLGSMNAIPKYSFVYLSVAVLPDEALVADALVDDAAAELADALDEAPEDAALLDAELPHALSTNAKDIVMANTTTFSMVLMVAPSL